LGCPKERLTIRPLGLTFAFVNPNSLANLAPAWTPETAKLASAEGNAKLARIRAERNSGVNPAIARIEKQLRKIETAMDKTTEPRDLASLAAAHARLFAAWQVLTGTPNPGQRRGRQERPRPPEVHRSPIPTPQEKTN
jgi:hypothetical protein